MAHLNSYRQGWQSENLALYFMYQFSFVARPWNSADDIGADYYCTLFEVVESRYLHPKGAFAMQIKSASDDIDISNKVDYFSNLQMPFFIGVVDKKAGTMDVYSGEYIPLFFCLVGNPLTPSNTERYRGEDTKVLFRCTVEQPDPDNYYQLDGASYILHFPFVARVTLDRKDEGVRALSNAIRDRSVYAQANIAALKIGSYVFSHFGTEQKTTVAGSTSINTFRINLQHRLAETFHNLTYLFKKEKAKFDVEEFRRYERAFKAAQFNPIDPLLERTYSEAKALIDAPKGPSLGTSDHYGDTARGASASNGV